MFAWQRDRKPASIARMPAPAAPFPVTPASVEGERFRRDADGRFVNLDGSGPHLFRDVYRWALADKLAGRRRKSPARAEVPAVAVDAEGRDSPGWDTRAGSCSSADSRC
jgi:hypothetical protein